MQQNFQNFFMTNKENIKFFVIINIKKIIYYILF